MLLLLPGCGDLPQPFRGRPGGEAARLAVPLAVRIAVPPPPQAMLGDAQARALAEQLAEALQAQEVPAVATETPWPLDWQVEILAEREGTLVRPRFRLLDPDRRQQAATQGPGVPVQAWAEGEPEALRRVAGQAAPNLARLLLQVDAARKQIDPAALAAGPPRIRFGGVRGAPGDGNAALAGRIREFLGNLGLVVQDTGDGATYGLTAEVLVTPPERNVQRVEIVWTVTRRDGQDLGRVAQLNEVPAGRLNGYWGDIAYAAAEEAAQGVRTVVANAQETRAAGEAEAPPGPATPTAEAEAPPRGPLLQPPGADAATAPLPRPEPPAAPRPTAAAATRPAAAIPPPGLPARPR